MYILMNERRVLGTYRQYSAAVSMRREYLESVRAQHPDAPWIVPLAGCLPKGANRDVYDLGADRIERGLFGRCD